MYCIHCGINIVEEAKFCQKCGNFVSRSSPSNKETNVTDTAPILSPSEMTTNDRGYLANILRVKSLRRLYLGLLLTFTSIAIFLIDQLSAKNAFNISFVLFLIGAVIVIRRATDLNDKNHYLYKVATLAGFTNLGEMSEDFVKTKGWPILGFPQELAHLGKYTMNLKYVYSNSIFYFNAYPLSQMHWAYKKVISKSVNFIPTGKDYELVMHFKPGYYISIKEDDDKVNKHLSILAARYPSAKFGYTKQ